MGVTKPLSQLNPGQHLGAFAIERLIGRGRHSEVYAANRTGSAEGVALKVFLPGVIRGPAHAAAFLDEMATLSQLSHPNIGRIVDYGCDAARDLCFIALERFEGTTLRDDITAHPSGYARDELWRLFEPLADALAAAHEQGRVHGSVRPDHIFFSGDRRPVLTDFSLSCLVDDRQTGRGAPLGVVTYWAPEQAAQIPPTAAADIYALGVLLYELAVGDVPFKARTRDALVAQHLYQAPAPPSELRPGLDPRIERAILIALRKNPADRFLSAREMLAIMSSTDSDDYATLNLDKRLAQEVRRRSANRGVRVPRAESPVPEAVANEEPPTRTMRRCMWIVAGILVAALLALALV